MMKAFIFTNIPKSVIKQLTSESVPNGPVTSFKGLLNNIGRKAQCQTISPWRACAQINILKSK